MRRIAITGSSGYYGRKLIQHIQRESPRSRILGIDLVAPSTMSLDEFAPLDVRSPQLCEVLAEFRPDTIVHLAFVVNPIHDARRMRDINVGGTQNVFAAVRNLRPARFLMASSGTAFGAWPDNPVPFSEDWPLRAREHFQYAAEKTALESELATLLNELPEVAVSWTRATIIAGQGVENYLSRLLRWIPMIVLPDGVDVPLQFVHEDDCAAATWEILRHNARGPFNVAPPNWVTMTQIARLTNRWAISLPFWIFKWASAFWWHCRLPIFQYPPSLHDFLRHPWVMSPTRLQQELGFRFQYSAEETLLEMWSHGRSLRWPLTRFSAQRSDRRAA